MVKQKMSKQETKEKDKQEKEKQGRQETEQENKQEDKQLIEKESKQGKEELLVKDNTMVVPGEILARGMSYLPGKGAYREQDHVIANRLGLLKIEGKVLQTLQVAGRYLPKKNDVVIGKVTDILMTGWRLDINSAYSAVLPLKDASFSYIARDADLTKYFELDDYVVVKITKVTTQKLVDITCKGPGLHKLREGRIIKVNTHKVPRIIGKKGSMVSLIKDTTGCQITVGQNGITWISGEPEMEVISVNVIRMIEEKSHVRGLTEEIEAYLKKAIASNASKASKEQAKAE